MFAKQQQWDGRRWNVKEKKNLLFRIKVGQQDFIFWDNLKKAGALGHFIV